MYLPVSLSEVSIDLNAFASIGTSGMYKFLQFFFWKSSKEARTKQFVLNLCSYY